jgi:hypothetical protein
MEENLKKVQIGHVVTMTDKTGGKKIALIAHIAGSPDKPVYHYVAIPDSFTKDDIQDIMPWHPIVTVGGGMGNGTVMSGRRKSHRRKSKN